MEEHPPQKDCFGCRLVSGSGLLGAGAYIANEARKNNNRWGKIAMNCISAGFASVGLARLLNIYPFNITHVSQAGVNKHE